MTDLVDRPLGAEAREYIAARLSQGKSLARYVLEKIDIERGSVRTRLPTYAPEASVRKLKVGGILHRDPKDRHYVEGKDGRSYRVELVATLEFDLVSIIKSSLTTWTWILEEGLADASDLWMKTRGGHLLTNGEEVYEVLSGGSSEEELAKAVLTMNRPWPTFLAFAIGALDVAELDSMWRQSILRAFEVVRQRLEEIVVGAYDGEAFVYWKPEQRN